MTLRAKKLVLIGTVAIVVLLANCVYIAPWLDRLGVVGWAQRVEVTFLTGTAITILLALLILIPPDWAFRRPRQRIVRCWVCHHPVDAHARYCGRCGSRLRRRGRCSSRRVPRWG